MRKAHHAELSLSFLFYINTTVNKWGILKHYHLFIPPIIFWRMVSLISWLSSCTMNWTTSFSLCFGLLKYGRLDTTTTWYSYVDCKSPFSCVTRGMVTSMPVSLFFNSLYEDKYTMHIAYILIFSILVQILDQLLCMYRHSRVNISKVERNFPSP